MVVSGDASRSTTASPNRNSSEAINEIHIPEALLRPHPFDAVKFFGDEAAAKEALSPGPGKSSFGLAK